MAFNDILPFKIACKIFVVRNVSFAIMLMAHLFRISTVVSDVE